MSYVYVLNKDGKPIMPTKRHNKVAYLLKHKLAYVVKRTPFTIRLNYSAKNYTQEVNLGVDAGSKVIGLSATTEKNILFEAEVRLRNDVSLNIYDRKMRRKVRRRRKTRYRKPRFNNRSASNKKGEVLPSIRQKIDCHKTVIDKVNSILPIKRIILELAAFDIQKIINPNIKGVEYQKGNQEGFWNLREYVLFRDDHTCQNCKGKSKDNILEVHHIVRRKIGCDAPNNLITLCKTCHQNFHNKKITLNFKRGEAFKDTTFMNILQSFLPRELKKKYPNVSETYGYLTKTARINHDLPKEHYIDARCISGNPQACNDVNYIYRMWKNRNHNRQLHRDKIRKGGKRLSSKSPFLLFNFRLNDKVLFDKKICFISGRRTRGVFSIKNIYGDLIKDGIIYKKLKLIEKAKSYRIDQTKEAV